MKNKALESYFSGINEEHNLRGLSKENIKSSFLKKLFFGLGRIPVLATAHDLYTALALCIRDRAFGQFVRSTAEIAEKDARVVAYFSAEYLPGPHLGKNLFNLGITETAREALDELDLELGHLLKQEVEPGLGNGGLGRLASCYMDSMATLGIPSIGYGIRYEFGIFKQDIKNGWQTEATDKWLHQGNPWEIARPEIFYHVKFGGHTEAGLDEHNRYQVRWIPETEVRGTAYDTPILGYKSNGIVLRLWKAEAVESFDFSVYNLGDYYRAVEEKMRSENITKVLYPNDENLSGKELRLKQQYFFVSCSLQDMIRLHKLQGRTLDELHQKFTVQLNDTHPSIAVAELMRLLVDVHEMDWEEAWYMTRHFFAYTNHTLLPEALEKWPVSLIRNVLPRHLEIIFEINQRFLNTLRKNHYTGEQISRMSLIEEGADPAVRMAHLAVVGSYKVNGVSELHSNLLKKEVLNDFAQLWPEKFTNVTNGIDQRRFLMISNAPLTRLLQERIGDGWINSLDQIREIAAYSENGDFQDKWMQVKLQNKKQLADYLTELTGVVVDPQMLFDIQVKRIHEYKRQHLKVLHILSLYLKIKKGEGDDIEPTVFLFAGKAAPGYFMAKLIIKLINDVAALINNDPEVSHRIKVIFLPNFNVKQAQLIYPAADISEQISLAGKEASGTGNMKFALNGALTVGTLDGANVEILEEVGENNFFLFGANTEEVADIKARGYRPYEFYEKDPELRNAMDFLISGDLSGGDTERFLPIYNNLLHQDPYLVLKDFHSYAAVQKKVHALRRQPGEWARKSILNVANMAKFTSDRSIREYCDKIWRIKPVRVE